MINIEKLLMDHTLVCMQQLEGFFNMKGERVYSILIVCFEAAFILLLCRRIIYLLLYSWEEAVDGVTSHRLSTTGFH